MVPERSVAEALVEALARRAGRARALVARAAEARDVLPDALRERGAEVDVLALYETVAEPLDDDARCGRAGGRLRHLHLVLDRALLPRAAGGTPVADGTRVVSIGPVTSGRCASTASSRHVEAERHDIDGSRRARGGRGVRAPC